MVVAKFISEPALIHAPTLRRLRTQVHALTVATAIPFVF